MSCVHLLLGLNTSIFLWIPEGDEQIGVGEADALAQRGT